MNRASVWLQLLVAWTPVWALFVMLLLGGHPGIGRLEAALVALRLIVIAAVLALAVRRLTRRLPWPRQLGPVFVAAHLVAAGLFALAWVLLNNFIDGLTHGHLTLSLGSMAGPFLVLGVWLYVTVAGVTYAVEATQRAAGVEAIAVRSQLAALRSQLNPHFLFNALHTVVHLIPREPQQAARAAEQIAGFLRSTVDEDRDVVSLEEEWALVERYVAIERIRFGDRLRLHVDLADDARRAQLPSFALQTLVENALRHGVMPRVEPTEVTVTARVAGGVLTVTVHDTGMGAAPAQIDAGGGTGLARLRERLAALYDGRARLAVAAGDAGGFQATLVIPQSARDDA